MSIKIGKIEYIKNQNSKIYNGIFHEDVSIKVRIVRDITEADVLKHFNLESHPNVQRIFGYEYKDSIFYLGLRSFDVTLQEFMKIPTNKRQKIDSISMIRNITEGLKFLHDNKIVHDNISFSNVGIKYNENIAMLCNCGFDDLQEDIFMTPEELSGLEPSYPSDVFNLGVIIYYILSNGSHPFGPLNNPSAIRDSIRTTQFDCNSNDFKILKDEGTSHKIECAKSLLKKMLSKDPEHRINCNETLKHPLFWNNHEIYKFFREINQSWKLLTVEDKKMINDEWFWLSDQHSVEEILSSYSEKSLIELVEFIAQKVRHFEDPFFIDKLKDEHIIHYMRELPLLLPFVYATTEIKEVKSTAVFQIPLGNIECNNRLHTNIYFGRFNSMDVAIKKTLKKKVEYFDAELKNIEKLSTRKELRQYCKSCKNIDCENILKFFGWYEEPKHWCLVFEKVEMNFENFLKAMNNENTSKVKKILYDAVKGLECLHANSIAHLNINPQNILIVMRNGIHVGCLANFGKVEDVITDCKSLDDDKTSVYIAPELKKKRENRAKTDYSRCDIYSLGILFQRDYLSYLLNLDVPKHHSKKDLYDLRKNKNISFLFEELVNFMTEEMPLKRPNAEGVRKSPFFWDANMKIQFLRNVSEYVEGNKSNIEKLNEIKERALKKLFVVEIQHNNGNNDDRKKKTEDWIDFLVENEEVYEEAIRFITQESDKSIFCLVKLILSIYDADDSNIIKSQLNASNPEEYLNFWLSKFELIGFLYYVMDEYMNKLFSTFYSTQTPKRVLGNRRMSSVLIERPNIRRNLCEIDANGEGCHF